MSLLPPRLLRAAIIAAACTLLIRLWVLFLLSGTVFLDQGHGDSAYYLSWAARVAGGRWSEGQAFLGLPLYPYLLAILQILHVPFPWGPLLLQALADACTGGWICLLIGFAAHQADLGQRASQAWMAAATAGWMFYVPAQGFAATLMPNTLATLAYVSFLGCAYLQRGESWNLRLALGWGLALGFCAMLSANLIFVLPLLLLRLRTDGGGRPPWLKLAVAGICLGAGLLLGASPSWVHNYFIAREPVSLSAHSGINFYIGNNPQANGYPNFPPGIRASQQGLLEDSARLAEEALGRPLRRYEVSAYWSQRARDFIRENPFAWTRLIFAKVRNYYSSYEYDDISILRPLRNLEVTTPGWGFGAVFVAAAMGLAGGFRCRLTRWAALAVLLQTFSVLPAFVTERYRLMAVPALVLTAASGWMSLVHRRDVSGWILAGVAGVAASLLAYSAPRPPGVELLADYNTAVRLLNAGLRAEALPLVEKIEAGQAANAEVSLMLGNFWQQAGENQRALGHYRTAIQRDPGLLRAWNNAAVLAIEEKNWPLAQALVRHLLQHAGSDSRVHYYAAQLAYARNAPAEAREHVQMALRLRPGEGLYLDLARRLQTESPPPPDR